MEKEMKEFVKDDKGQLTIIGLFLLYLTLLTLSAMMPNMLTVINTLAVNLTANGYTTEASLIRLYPMDLILTLLSTVAMYATAWR